MNNLPWVFGLSNINHFKQTITTKTTKKEGVDLDKNKDKNNFKKITTTTIEGIIDMKDLPEVFGSSDINKFKQVTTTTIKTQKEGDE